MKAISIRAPWWWFILYCGKDIENRDEGWKSYRGPILLHASNTWKKGEVYEHYEHGISLIRGDARLPDDLEQLRAFGSHIVGQAEVMDCVTSSTSPWFFGPYGLVLRNVVPFATPIPFKGAQGPFDVPDNLLPKAA